MMPGLLLAATPAPAVAPACIPVKRATSSINPVFGSSESSIHHPQTPASASSSSPVQTEDDAKLRDINKYIALGCLRFESPLRTAAYDQTSEWVELVFPDLPDEVKLIIGDDTTRLLEASWIRLFHHRRVQAHQLYPGSIARVYLLPEDWGRRLVDRRSKSLKTALRDLLARVDTSTKIWFGDPTGEPRYFDPWASAENVSLYYLFNKLPSPDPSAELVRNRYARNAVQGLLNAARLDSYDDPDDPPIPGLKTQLYPYQARSAALMVQREAAPQLQLDPRLEVRQSPTGEKFYFGARDGSFLREERFYETNRGGILAETMGLGKTIICLATILATKEHMPQIPPAYRPAPTVRAHVGSLAEMAAQATGRNSIPAKAYLESLDVDLAYCKHLLEQTVPYYGVPAEIPRMNRNTTIPPPQQLILCGATIIVVPRNLLHQWQSEIRKHVTKDGLKILVMDSQQKRAPKGKPVQPVEDTMDFRSEIPAPTDLMKYDVILFTRNRFEQEIQDGADDKGRRLAYGAPTVCDCPYIGATRERDCTCLFDSGLYKSPLKKLHWLRIIIDEGHNFSSGLSNAVLFAKQIHVERRWVVSGTPAKNLVGVELDLVTEDHDGADPALLREQTMEQRKNFSLDPDNIKAAKALGSLASNFLMVRPWSDSVTEGKLEWDDYIYRHEHQHKRTYSGFSECFSRTLEGLVVKTRPEDVERDIQLPPMRHRTVYLKPTWYDKMTANLFIQVLRANAITSERTDVDYLFHKNSLQARHSLIRNLRQSNFAWTGFEVDHVVSTIETSNNYLQKADKNCSREDALQLLESCSIVCDLLKSDGWVALSKAHEVGLAVQDWPQESEDCFSFATSGNTATIGISQLLEGQSHVDRQILLERPDEGLDSVGKAAKAKLEALEEAERKINESAGGTETRQPGLTKAAVPSSCVAGQPLTSRRTSTLPLVSSPKKFRKTSAGAKSGRVTGQASRRSRTVTPVPSGATVSTLHEDDGPLNGMIQPTVSYTATAPVLDKSHTEEPLTPAVPASSARTRKRKITLEDEKAELPEDSTLRRTRIVGTTSAKLTYLLQMVMKHQASDKIIIFYDGDNAAYYLAQCLEMLYVNHRIYARTLDNTKRSQYVKLFNEDPDVRVLLIDVACGALGLNLNVASVVLIMNPINRPGLEAQAIKRAHRIGQTKEVLVETLVLEGTIEEAIFKRAKSMSRGEHQEAKTLEDDNQITSIIQNASVLPIEPGESEELAQFALLETPEQVFGRPGREKYHRFGQTEAKTKEPADQPRKRARMVVKTQEPGKAAVAPVTMDASGRWTAIHPGDHPGDSPRVVPAESIFGSSMAVH